MSHLEYQTPFHPGPFAAQQQAQQSQHQQHQAQQHAQQQPGHQQQQQQAYTHSHSPNPHQFHAPGGIAASPAPSNVASISASPSVSSAPHAQAFAPAPSYPGHNLSRPPPPQFNDGLMQHQPNNYSPAGSFAAGQQNPYTSAPFAQSVTATSATPPPQQQQQQAIRHSASPQQLNSPYAGPQHQFQQPGQPQLQQQQQTPKQQTPPTRYPMAAPPLPQTPNAVAQAGATAAGSPQAQAPQSPGTQAREQKRVDMLLEINMELLQEINNLQAQGRGGAMNPQHQVQLRQLNMDDSMAAEEYIHCLRRVQANLAYLAPRADTQQAMKAPPGPAHMTPPAHMPQLQPKYDQLRELFPGWTGNDMRMAQNAGSPRTGQMNSMNGMNSQTAQA